MLLQVGEPGSKVDMDVGDRATPVVVDWDGDGRKDVVSGDKLGRVRVFMNEGTDTEPDLRTSQFLSDGGVDLVVPGVRSSPCVADFDDDGRKDLLTGNTSGQVLLYVNTGTDSVPSFSGYEFVTADSVVIDLAGTPRSRPFTCDWTGDGSIDLLVGSSDGLVRLYQGVGHMVGIEQVAGHVRAARLGDAYPNPFNPRVSIPFETATSGRVRMTIHDTAGRLVVVLLDEERGAGEYTVTWHGRDRRGRELPSGVYMTRLVIDHDTDVSRLVLLR